MNLYEYCSLIVIVARPQPKESQQSPNLPSVGRKNNPSFDFLPEHALFRTHVQRLRTKPATVMLAAPGAPAFPGPEPSIFSAGWRRKAKAFAKYCSVLLIPWELGQYKIDGVSQGVSWRSCLSEYFNRELAPTASQDLSLIANRRQII